MCFTKLIKHAQFSWVTALSKASLWLTIPYTVECRYNGVQYNMLLHKHCSDWSRIWIRIWIHQNTPNLALTGELWCVFNEYFGVNWSRHNSTSLYIISILLHSCITTEMVYGLVASKKNIWVLFWCWGQSIRSIVGDQYNCCWCLGWVDKSSTAIVSDSLHWAVRHTDPWVAIDPWK